MDTGADCMELYKTGLEYKKIISQNKVPIFWLAYLYSTAQFSSLFPDVSTNWNGVYKLASTPYISLEKWQDRRTSYRF